MRGARSVLRLRLEEQFHGCQRLLWEQRFHGDGKTLGKADQFRVCNPAEAGFNFRESFPADVPTRQIELRDEHRLSHGAVLAQAPDLRADDVARMLGCPFGFQNSLDPTDSGLSHGSEFRTPRNLAASLFR